MNRKLYWGRIAIGCMVMGWFGVAPAQADEKPTPVESISAEVILVRDAVVKKFAETSKPAEESVASKEAYDKVKADLAKKWTETFGTGIKAIEGLLKEKRLAIGSKIEGPEERTVSIQRALRTEFQQRLEDLEAAVGEDAVKKVLEGFDAPKATHEDAAKKQKALAGAGLAALGEAKWAAVMLQIAEASDTVSQQLEAARQEVQKLRDDAEAEERADFNKADGFARTVTCDFKTIDDKGRMLCSPGLLVNGADIGAINIVGLPPGKEVTVLASSSSESLVSTKRRQAVSGQSEGCLKAGSSLMVLSCDELVLNAGQGGAASVSVYMNRLFRPRYGGIFGGPNGAVRQLRPERYTFDPDKTTEREALKDWAQKGGTESLGQRPQLSLVVSGSASQVFLRVRVGDGKETGALATGFVQLGYERFHVETGGFIGISDLTDDEVVTEPTENGKVKITAITDGSNYSQESGLFLNFVPRNYPKWGLGLGFSTDSERPVSIYLGPSIRFRTFGQRGLASFSSGILLRSVDRFPGLEARLNQEIDADSPLLRPHREYETSWYFAINLGFSFGPIAGPGGNGGSN